MTAIAVWWLLILSPIDASGRQVGPFASLVQCRHAQVAYNDYWSNRRTPQSICVEGVR